MWDGIGRLRTKNSLYTPNVINYEMHDLLDKDWTKPFIESIGNNERIFNDGNLITKLYKALNPNLLLIQKMKMRFYN